MQHLKFALRLSAAACVAGAMLTGAPAAAAVKVTKATIAAGRLVVEGTATPNAKITLDSAYAATATGGVFKFSLGNYHPGDCVVRLKSDAAGEQAVTAVVAQCGLMGLKPRGAWATETAYAVNDVTSHEGSSWRAIKSVPATAQNATPGQDAGLYWETLAARGEDGIQGAAGANGADGVPGEKGEPGLPGADGKDGVDGADGAPGEKGEPGLPGADGKDGVDGADGAPGEKGEPGLPGADGKDGVDGADGAPGEKGEPGLPGADGKDGVDGTDGAPGTNGIDGTNGADGTNGIDGKNGKDGVNGKDGAPGLSNRIVVVGETSAFDEQTKSASASCPDGTVALGGGYKFPKIQFPTSMVVTENTIVEDGSWRVSARLGTDKTSFNEGFSIAAYVICATVSQ